MDLMLSLKIAASGLRAQSGRMRVIAENLANSASTATTPGGDPYRRRVPTFETEIERESGVQLIKPGRILADRSQFETRYQPGHPAADERGYVKLPNVNPVIETADMREAQRSYEANLNVVGATRRMLARTLDILRS